MHSTATATPGRRARLGLFALAAAAAGGVLAGSPGCGTIRGLFAGGSDAALTPAERAELPSDPAPDDAQESPTNSKLSATDLRGRNRAFADRYRVVLASACDTIMDRRDDPLVRRRAHQLKIDGATAIYDIAVDPSPRSALLNLVVQVTLQKKLANATAKAEFPDDHPLVEQNVEQLYREVWSHAALVMSERERVELLSVIDRWWEANGGAKGVWYVRLSDLAGYGGGTSFEGMIDAARGLPSSLLNTLVPLNDATESLDEITAVSESATWFAPRLVVLTQWRLEAIVFEALASTELTDTVDAIRSVASTADTLPERIGDELNTTIAAMAEREDELSSLLERAGSVTAEATRLAEAVEGTAGAATALSESVKPLIASFQKPEDRAPPAEGESTKPFDIAEYTRTAEALEATLAEAATLVERLRVSTDPDALRDRADALTGALTGAAGVVLLYAALAAVAVVLSIAACVIAVRRLAPRAGHDARLARA